MYYCCICKFLKELLSIVSFETWCKGKDFYFYLPNFFEVFFRFIFFGSLFRNDFRTFAWIFQPHPSVSIFPGSLTPLSSCHHRISLDCGCKSTAVKHIIQMFFQLFCNYFLLFLIVNDLQMNFSPFFWLDTKETKTSLEICFTPSPFGRSSLTSISLSPFFISPSQILNSQSSILNSQKAGVFLSFHAGFSAKDAGFFPFYAYLSKSNKRESISILVGFTFDSRLSGLAFFYYIPTIP